MNQMHSSTYSGLNYTMHANEVSPDIFPGKSTVKYR